MPDSPFDERAQALEAIVLADGGWSRPQSTFDFNGVRWRPDLVHDDGLFMQTFFDELDESWRTRLSAAHQAGHRAAVACPPAALTVPTLAFLQEIDALILLLDVDLTDAVTVRPYPSVAHLVAQYELALEHGGLRLLGETRLDQALAATTNDTRGRYFEEVLLLLFSQVSYLVVLDTRFKNATEEIDLVLGNRGTGPIAGIIGGPLIVVSAKNRTDSIGAPEVRALWGNMTKRRGRCQLGILCASRKLASTASTERSSATTDPTLAVALLDGSTIRSLLQTEQLDAELEIILRDAVMG